MAKVKCICNWCDRIFYVDLSRIRTGRGKYCSKECYDLSKVGKNYQRIKRDIIIKNDYALVPLGQNNIFSKIDKDDIELVKKYTWCCDGRNNWKYAITKKLINGKYVKIYLHRLIMNCPNNMTVDHINHNGLDNRKTNLRVCPIGKNVLNQRKRKNTSSKYKGVSWDKKLKKWESYIKNISKKEHLGYFNNEKDAALIYNERAKELFGEFAYLNKIDQLICNN